MLCSPYLLCDQFGNNVDVNKTQNVKKSMKIYFSFR